ncbi:hypothetical protein BJX68DRAFT_261769 [Aspergillus pseudodeflectus]|uniref:Uncharacterized protein n=1 Tax=Aspergillus pseudodeflectus TaxID=176178 RepID=A0ABR4L4K8_9EURO
MILTKKLLRRLGVDNGVNPEFSNSLWVQLILADQSSHNVQLKAVQTAFDPLETTGQEDYEQHKDIEMTRQAGDQVLEGRGYDNPISLYSKAINLDSANATTRW